MSSRVFFHNYGPIANASEPMALGSPPTSPGSVLPQGATPNQPYLPGFLMGDSPQIQMAAVNVNTHGSSRAIQLSPTNAHVSGNGKTKHTEVAFVTTPSIEPRLVKRHTSPPTQSIWDLGQPGSATRSVAPVSSDCQSGNRLTVRHSTPNAVARGGMANSSILSPLGSSNQVAATEWMSRQPLAELSVSPANNILSTERLAEVLIANQRKSPDAATDESWITVFGFPPARATFLLSQFAQLGTIEKHVITNDGNWMHIKYQNKLQARCALSRNGRVFGENIMVGVAPCTDQTVLSESGDRKSTTKMLRPRQMTPVTNISSPPIRQLSGSTGFRQPLNSRGRPEGSMNQSFTASPCPPRERMSSLARNNSMRSLAGRTPGSHLTRTASVRQEPGLLSKALGYMFGWP